MIVIGITGPTGAGKSFFCDFLNGMKIPSINADRVYHDMLVPPSECLDAIRLAFGDSVFEADGSLDRAKLGAIVFSSPEKLELLNTTVLTRVITKIKEIISEYKSQGCRAVAIDAPTLIESGFDKECDAVISILASKELRTSRIIDRDSIDEKSAELRINAQKDDSFYINNSNFVINNTKDAERFKNDAIAILERLGLK